MYQPFLSPPIAGVPQVTWSRQTPLANSACTRSVPAAHVTGARVWHSRPPNSHANVQRATVAGTAR